MNKHLPSRVEMEMPHLCFMEETTHGVHVASAVVRVSMGAVDYSLTLEGRMEREFLDP